MQTTKGKKERDRKKSKNKIPKLRLKRGWPVWLVGSSPERDDSTQENPPTKGKKKRDRKKSKNKIPKIRPKRVWPVWLVGSSPERDDSNQENTDNKLLEPQSFIEGLFYDGSYFLVGLFFAAIGSIASAFLLGGHLNAMWYSIWLGGFVGVIAGPLFDTRDMQAAALAGLLVGIFTALI